MAKINSFKAYLPSKEKAQLFAINPDNKSISDTINHKKYSFLHTLHPNDNFSLSLEEEDTFYKNILAKFNALFNNVSTDCGGCAVLLLIFLLLLLLVLILLRRRDGDGAIRRGQAVRARPRLPPLRAQPRRLAAALRPRAVRPARAAARRPGVPPRGTLGLQHTGSAVML